MGHHPQGGGLRIAPPEQEHVAVLGDVGVEVGGGAISPTGSHPHTCLAPQYHPSQESMLRIWRVYPPMRASSRLGQPWLGATRLPSPCMSLSHSTASGP